MVGDEEVTQGQTAVYNWEREHALNHAVEIAGLILIEGTPPDKAADAVIVMAERFEQWIRASEV